MMSLLKIYMGKCLPEVWCWVYMGTLQNLGAREFFAALDIFGKCSIEIWGSSSCFVIKLTIQYLNKYNACVGSSSEYTCFPSNENYVLTVFGKNDTT